MRLLLALASLAFTVASCAPGKSTLPPTPPCTGANCNPGTGGGVSMGGMGGGGAGGFGGGGDGGGGMGDPFGNIVRLEEPTFVNESAFAGTGVNIFYQSTMGQASVSPLQDGSFTLPNVSSNALAQWLRAEVTDVSAGALCTISKHDLSSSPFSLPVVNTINLSDVGALLQPPVALDPNKMHMIYYAGLAGVSLASMFQGATVAYDIGPGQYSSSTTVTDTGGTILVLNANVVSNFSVTINNGGMGVTVNNVLGSQGCVSLVHPGN